MLKGYLQGITTALWGPGRSQSLVNIWLTCYTLNLGQLSPAIPISESPRKGHTSYYSVELKMLLLEPFPKWKGLQELAYQHDFSSSFKEQHLRWYCTILARRIFNVAISMQQHTVCLQFFHFIISFNRKIWVPKKPLLWARNYLHSKEL